MNDGDRKQQKLYPNLDKEALKRVGVFALEEVNNTRDPMVWSEAGGLSCTQEYRGKVKVWFGYKEGRVVFLSNSHEHDIHPDLMPSFFEGFASVMQCAKTPRRFVEDFTQEEVEAFGPNLQLHERRLRVNDVGHGVHTISVYGFDACILRDDMLKVKFNEMIARHAKLPPIKNIVEDLMMKSPFFIDSVDGAGKKVRYRTVRTLGMDIKANRPQGRFYERHLNDNGEWVG
ncbi:F2D10.17 [Arabidopsis thaliana]|uniref:F2D10.17 n=1 Tax=Arabidopsis thaliana TaxID=3702 RepID=Q9LM86_ARATH|nr:F2D10.17 [Arabidopsis thaliana]